MITRDYHGYFVDDALTDAELVIGQVRATRKSEQAEFITGYGKIRSELVNLLRRYGLTPHHKIGNDGTIIVTIE